MFLTRGCEIFSAIPNPVSKNDLEAIFRNKHLLEENGQATVLIHPSACSMLAIDILFNKLGWSTYSVPISRILNRMQSAIGVYILSNMLDLFIKEPEVRDKAQLQSIIRTFIRGLNDIDASNRILKISNQFVKAIKLQMTLGIIPVRYQKIESDHVPSDKEAFLQKCNAYLRTIEEGLNRLSTLENDQITTNLLIFQHHNGHKSISGIRNDNNIIGLQLPLHDFHLLRHVTQDLTPGVCKLVQHELFFSYAHHEMRKFMLDKLTNTTILVSSSLRKEVLASLSATHTSIRGDLHRMLDQVKDDQSRLDQIKESNITLQHAYEEVEQQRITNPVDLQAHINHQLQQLHELEADQKRIWYDAQSEMHNERYQAAEEEASINDINVLQGCTPYGSFAPASMDQARHDKALHKSLQEQNMASELKIKSKLVNKLNQSITTYKRELSSFQSEVNRLMNIKRSLENQLKYKQKEMALLDKNNKEKDKVNEKLRGQMKNLADSMSSALVSLQLSQDERDRLVTSLMDNTSTSTKYMRDLLPNDHDRCEFHAQLNDLLGSYGTDKWRKCLDKLTQTGRHSYDQLLTKYCVRPLTLFSRIRCEKDLNQANQWTPMDWMKDVLVRDAAWRKKSLLYANHTIPNDEANLPNLTVIDVNPLTTEREEYVRAALTRECVASSEQSPWERRYLTTQFKSCGDFVKAADKPLMEIWDQFVQSYFELSGEKITITGQRMEPALTTQSLLKFCAPFIHLYTGLSPNVLSADMAAWSDREFALSDDDILSAKHFSKEGMRGIIEKLLCSKFFFPEETGDKMA